MGGDTRRRRGGWLLAVFVLALVGAAAPVLAGCDRCCDEMQGSAPRGCEALAAATCCEAPVAVYSGSLSQVPPATSTVCDPIPPPGPAPSLHEAQLPSSAPLQTALIRSVVLRL